MKQSKAYDNIRNNDGKIRNDRKWTVTFVTIDTFIKIKIIN